MKKYPAFILISMLALSAGCDSNESTTSNLKTNKEFTASNPFYEQSSLPFQAVPFDKIKNEDFTPAFEAGMENNLEEIQQIADNTEEPTFDNTFLALEKSGRLLSRVSHAFFLLSGANTNDDLQKIQEEVAPKLAALSDARYLNTKLFQRVETLYNKRDQLNLDPESKRLVEYYQQKFILAGAKLSDEDKAQLKKLNEEEASLSAKFSNQLFKQHLR